MSAKDFDAIIFVSQTSDYIHPATACVIPARLGCGWDCIAFDVNLGGSGFVYGCGIAASMLNMPSANKVLLCGGDTISKLIAPDDSASAMLFGDGGFAALFERSSVSSTWHCAWGTDGTVL